MSKWYGGGIEPQDDLILKVIPGVSMTTGLTMTVKETCRVACSYELSYTSQTNVHTRCHTFLLEILDQDQRMDKIQFPSFLGITAIAIVSTFFFTILNGETKIHSKEEEETPTEAGERIIRFATTDYSTARALSTVSNVVRTWIPPVFFRTTFYWMSTRKYYNLRPHTKSFENVHFFWPNASSQPRYGNWTALKHLSVSIPTLLDTSVLVPFGSCPHLTHVVLEVQVYHTNLFHLGAFQTVTHLFLRIDNVGLYPYHIIQQRHSKLAHSMIKSRIKKLAHRNLEKIVVLPPRDFRACDWYSWEHPDGPSSVWDEAERLLAVNREVVSPAGGKVVA
ncbi:hypothetical protein BU17DRAFT_67085 [Hysterangium stoloniferum]|nr:hypothetical protein BU17DRAFT_67085 [Hysterangium stoloniferum]